MAAPTVKRKAAPRKRAQAGSGALPEPEAAPVPFEGSGDGPSSNGVGVAASPYGSKAVYRYKPVDGGGDILFPHISEIEVDAYFFWKIYELNEMFQAFEWMKKAGVPRSIQSRVMQLPPAEQAVFFSGWFEGVAAPQGVSPPGE